jgi:hypothetical protein
MVNIVKPSVVKQDTDPFSEFINCYLSFEDDPFTPIEYPAPNDRRWRYGQYKAPASVTIYSQPNIRYVDDFALRRTDAYAHALLRYLPDVRPGWTAIELTLSTPIIGYVRNDCVSFRRSSGIYEYFLMLMNSALIVLGLSALILLYTMPHPNARTASEGAKPSRLERQVERLVTRLEMMFMPLE